jgi:hypothetical protein
MSVDVQLLAANLLINAVDAVGLFLLYQYWKARKNSVISVRRPELMVFSVLYPIIMDWIWTIDTISYSSTGGLGCVWWELLLSLYYAIFMEVLAMRTIVLYLSFNRVAILQDAVRPLRSEASSGGGGDEEEMIVKIDFTPEQLEELQKLAKYTSKEFLFKIILILIGIHSIPFFIYLMVNPELASLPFSSSPVCYLSGPYQFNVYVQVLMSLIVIGSTYLMRLKNDLYHIKRELVLLAGFWIAYNVLNFGIYSWLALYFPYSIWYIQAWVWPIVVGTFY